MPAMSESGTPGTGQLVWQPFHRPFGVIFAFKMLTRRMAGAIKLHTAAHREFVSGWSDPSANT
jgi:hypothetical protein